MPEPEHCPLSPPEGQVAVLDPVIGPSTDFLFCLTSKVSHGGTVGSEAVGCDCCRRPVTPQRLLHECESGRFITGFGDVALEDFAFVVDGAKGRPSHRSV